MSVYQAATSPRTGDENTSVSFDSWNHQLAWHPPLLQPGRSLVEARADIVNVRATALRGKLTKFPEISATIELYLLLLFNFAVNPAGRS